MRRRSDYPAYLALRAALGVSMLLPRRAALAAGALLFRAARGAGMRRSVTDDNLAKAFPELTAPARAALARAVYAHFGRMTVDSLRVSAAGAQALAPLVRSGDAVRLIQERLLRGKGVIVLTGHIGNWELAGAYLAAAGIEVAAVVKPPSNPYVARRAETVRRGLGIETISMDSARSGVMAALARNKTVALVADQGALRSGTLVPFFGRPTRTPQGPGLFAALSGAPVLFGALLALPGGGYEETGEVIEEHPAGEPREVAERVARRFRERLEALVRRVPEQYLWTHRLWKELPPPPGAP